MSADRAALEARWLELTRVVLPGLAAEHRWPVRNDHCFQRILLDAACGGVWYDHVPGRPAYRHLRLASLEAAVTIGDAVAQGRVALDELNNQSLRWRGKARTRPLPTA